MSDDVTIRGQCLYFSDEAPTPALPVRCLDDELTPHVAPAAAQLTARSRPCRHCGIELTTALNGRGEWCRARVCVEAQRVARKRAKAIWDATYKAKQAGVVR